MLEVAADQLPAVCGRHDPEATGGGHGAAQGVDPIADAPQVPAA